MFTVSLAVPNLEGSVPDDPEDAAVSFVGVLIDWFGGAIDTLALDVTDEYTGQRSVVHLSAVEAQALLGVTVE